VAEPMSEIGGLRSASATSWKGSCCSANLLGLVDKLFRTALYDDHAHQRGHVCDAEIGTEPANQAVRNVSEGSSALPWMAVGLLLWDVLTVLICVAAVHVWLCRMYDAI